MSVGVLGKAVKCLSDMRRAFPPIEEQAYLSNPKEEGRINMNLRWTRSLWIFVAIGMIACEDRGKAEPQKDHGPPPPSIQAILAGFDPQQALESLERNIEVIETLETIDRSLVLETEELQPMAASSASAMCFDLADLCKSRVDYCKWCRSKPVLSVSEGCILLCQGSSVVCALADGCWKAIKNASIVDPGQ